MTTQQIRQAYIDFFIKRGHKQIPRALLVPQNDPTTLFTTAGMQPLIPYLLGEEHPEGKRLVDSQPCLRAQDIEEVGDNRHTTFFEMLGNWSLGDYFKKEEIPWLFEFLTDVVGLDPNNLYVTCYIGNKKFNIPKDSESAELWTQLFQKKKISTKQVEIGTDRDGYEKGMNGGRIFYYDGKKNWWSRGGDEASTPVGDPGGPDTEVFFDFGIPHDEKWGKHCHPNCDCGRFVEIANSVFMSYERTEQGFKSLPEPNVDFGGGLERISVAAINDPDIFKISLLKPIITKLEQISGKNYESHTLNMRVIADHLRSATFLAVDEVVPSNKEQGYVMRRLIRRAIRYSFDLGIDQSVCNELVPVIVKIYEDNFPEIKKNAKTVEEVLSKEEKIFRQTLRSGVREFDKLAGKKLTGEVIFKLYDTYGFPSELSLEEAFKKDIQLEGSWKSQFDKMMEKQRSKSRTATKGEFKGGLADHSAINTKYHTATHLMYRALKQVLGEHVIQRGSNITPERTRFDFSHPSKMTPEEIAKVEQIVNEQIDKDWPVSWREESTKAALASGVAGAFGDRYGDKVKVYTIGDPDGKHFSREICGGPHVEHTGQIGEGNKRFKIIKEESSSAGIRRIKAVIQ
ncbi:MAG TPA: alanine--tRNA ligase [Candidatus Saccharimonadales bacterium]|nr:alanine--tRNA ligase [Candidatus Saccharimonadales bacterium]